MQTLTFKFLPFDDLQRNWKIGGSPEIFPHKAARDCFLQWLMLLPPLPHHLCTSSPSRNGSDLAQTSHPGLAVECWPFTIEEVAQTR